MDLKVTIDVSGWESLIQDIKNNLNGDQLLARSSQLIRDDISKQFIDQGTPAWKPLSEMRFRQRAKKNSANLLILIDSGSLLTSWVSTEVAGHVEVITTDSITVGTSLEKAEVLHGGGVNKKGFYVPARPVVWSENVLQSIAESVAERLLESTK